MLINKEKSIRVNKNNCIGRWKTFECKKIHLYNTVITNIPTWLIMNMILF